MEQFRAQNFAPKFVTFLPFDTQYSNIDTGLSDFITGCSRVSYFAQVYGCPQKGNFSSRPSFRMSTVRN